MIKLSDIELWKIDENSYIINGANGTELKTDKIGVHALLAIDCCPDKSTAIHKVQEIIGYEWDVEDFFNVVSNNGLIFDATYDFYPFFNTQNVKSSLINESFRSISEINLCPFTKCNLNCSYCIIKQDDSKLSLDKIEQLLNNASQLGANNLNILGGEPTLYSEYISNIILTAKNLNFDKVLVSTNGKGLTKQIAELWRKSGLKRIQLSIDNLKGKNKSLENLREMLAMACEIFPEVCVAYVFSGQHSLYEAEEFINELLKYPVIIDIKPAIPNDNEKLCCNILDLNKFRLKAKQWSNEHTNVFLAPTGSHNNVWCGAGGAHVYIHSDGNVSPCAFLSEKVGNINYESFKAIWNDYSRWEEIRQPVELPNKCSKCNYYETCIGGCKARFRSSKFNCIFNIKRK